MPNSYALFHKIVLLDWDGGYSPNVRSLKKFREVESI